MISLIETPSLFSCEIMRNYSMAISILAAVIVLGAIKPVYAETKAATAEDVSPFTESDLTNLKVDLNGVWCRKPNDKDFGRPDGREVISMGLFVEGLSSRYLLRVERVQVKLETKVGEVIAVVPQKGPIPVQPPNIPAMQAALGSVRLYAARNIRWDIVPLFSLPATVLAKHWSEFLKFSATLDLQVAEYFIKEREALTPGTGGRKIGSVQTMDDKVTIHLPTRGGISAFSEQVFVLQNTKSREALLGHRTVIIDADTDASVGESWEFQNEDSPTGKLLTKEWLADAEILVLDLRKVGAFTRTFTKDPLQLSFDIPGQRGKKSDYDQARLNLIVLPDHASKAQMADYVSAIMEVSHAQKYLGYEDPQVAMLMKVGPQNLEVLIDGAPVPRTWKDVHIWEAIREMAGVEHRDLILRRLSDKPDLADVLEDTGATELARPVLLKGLQDHRNDLPASWIEAVLSFRDPSTYDAITDYFLRNPTEPGLYEKISKVPGIDLGKIVGVAWAKAKEGNIRQQSFMIHGACEGGLVDALATAAEWLRNPASDYPRRVGRAVLKRFTPADGSDEELLAWYDAHKDSLVFDPDQKMFKGKH